MWPSRSKRNPRVADENVLGADNGAENMQRPCRLSDLILALLAVPLEALYSCLVCRSGVVNDDGYGYGYGYVAAHETRGLGVNEHVLRESMRYAIYL